MTVHSIAVVALLFVIAALPPTSVAQIAFGPDVPVRPPGSTGLLLHSAGQRNIAAVGDTIYTVWMDRGAYFARSVNRGVSFQAAVRVDDSSIALYPSLAVSPDGQIVCVVWEDRRSSPYAGIPYFDRSTDGGRTFGVDQQLASQSAYSRVSVAMDAQRGKVFVAWRGATIRMAVSSNSGASFEPDCEVTQPDWVIAEAPVLAVAPDGRVLIAYDHLHVEYMELFVIESHDGGATFTQPIWGSGLSVATSIAGHSIAVDPFNRTHIGWGHRFLSDVYPDTLEVRYAVTEPGNLNFGTTSRVCPINGYYYGTFSLAVSATNVFMSWIHGNQVRFCAAGNPAAGFSPYQIVNDPAVTSSAFGSSVCAASDGSPCLLWEAQVPGGSAYLFDRGSLTTSIALGESAGESAAGSDPAVRDVVLEPAPNPTRGDGPIRIRYRLAPGLRTVEGTLRILDTRGRLLRSYTLARAGDAVREVSWDLAGEGGEAVSSGVYFLRIDAGDVSRAVRVVVSR